MSIKKNNQKKGFKFNIGKYFNNQSVGVMFIFVSFVVLFQAGEYYWKGFHNIDLVHNYQIISFDVNPYLLEQGTSMHNIFETYDNTSSGVVYPLSSMYRIGLNQTLFGMELMFIAGMVLAMGIFLIASKEEK